MAAPHGGPGYRRLLERLESVRSLGVDLGLDRVRAALSALGSPDRRFTSVQIAGTNGKGSTAAITEAILRASGVRTGLFTSPHLARFTERIRIDGAEIDPERLARLDAAVAALKIPLTYFEVSAALAALAFADAGVEVAVLETGLGGRLDAATAFPVVAAAITSVGLDHTELLGATLAEVAVEKAGVARPDLPLILPPDAMTEEVEEAIARHAAAVGAQPSRAPALPRGLAALEGSHQRANAAIAVALASRALAATGRVLTEQAIERGLADVRWPGRMEWIRRPDAPALLLDGAHNPDAGVALGRALAQLGGRCPRVLVTSMVRGKQVAATLAPVLANVPHVIATRSRNPRSMAPAELAAVVAGAGCMVTTAPDAEQALERATAIAGQGSVLVAGSLFLVGEVRASVLDEAVDPIAGGDPLP